MMSQEQNDLITRTGPKDPCGKLMRSYWQPAALVDELEGERPIRPVKLLGENLVLFRDETGRYGLIDRHCAHRGADLAFGRLEHGGLRCAFHGWLFDATGQCIETPAEPKDSKLCQNIRQRSYPVVEKSGILWAYLGEGEPPAFPELDCFVAPGTHTFAFKGHMACNWLQALEVGIDPAHASYLHRFFEDEDTSTAYGKQFRGASAGSDLPMTKILREYDRPIINVEHTEYGLRLIALREIDEERTHVRVTNQLFPHGFVIPMSTEMTITQWHVPVDDENCYWYAIFTSYSNPVDKTEDARPAARALRAARLQVAQEPQQRLRLRSARAADRDLYRHGQRHQRPRPVGGGIDGRDPGPHQGASRLERQGDRAISPPAAAGDREGRRRREADAVPGRGQCALASRARRRWTASGRRAAGRPTGWKSTSSAAAARRGPRRCRRRSPTTCIG